MGQLLTFKWSMCSFCVLMVAFSSRELVVHFFDRVLELEESLGSSQLLQQNLKLKDEKVSSLNQVIQEKEDLLDDLENRCSCYSCVQWLGRICLRMLRFQSRPGHSRDLCLVSRRQFQHAIVIVSNWCLLPVRTGKIFSRVILSTDYS